MFETTGICEIVLCCFILSQPERQFPKPKLTAGPVSIWVPGCPPIWGQLPSPSPACTHFFSNTPAYSGTSALVLKKGKGKRIEQ